MSYSNTKVAAEASTIGAKSVTKNRQIATSSSSSASGSSEAAACEVIASSAHAEVLVCNQFLVFVNRLPLIVLYAPHGWMI